VLRPGYLQHSACEHALSRYAMVDAMFSRPNASSMPGMRSEMLGLCILNEDQVGTHSENISWEDHISTVSVSSISLHLSISIISPQQATGSRLQSFGLTTSSYLSFSISSPSYLYFRFAAQPSFRCVSLQSPHCCVQSECLLLPAHRIMSADLPSANMESVVALLARHA
jgi:hypothetical protein